MANRNKQMSCPTQRKSSLNISSFEWTNLYKQSMVSHGLLAKVESILGFQLQELTSFKQFCKLMYRPTDPSSLAVVRILFGLLMMVDTLEERGLAEADLKWGDPHSCHFPLFSFLQPLPLEWMCLLYLTMWLGAAGITLGVYFRLSCICFVVPYWYLFLLDKSTWNNHSYLYGLLSVMFLLSSAHHCWSVDGLLKRAPSNCHVPLWNYAILRFQLFILYFVAGLKKMDRDWLNGYSMSSLSSHWLFDPFKIFMTEEQVGFWIVHFFGFSLDLTVGLWLYFDKTRPTALLFLTSFHVMNSRLFSIGMFPYVCLATMPIFCHSDWPKHLMKSWIKNCSFEDCKQSSVCFYPSKSGKEDSKKDVRWYHKMTSILLLTHVFLQGFLPYSHFLTKGYNNWTNGLYGYSWDMMVHSWDTVLVVVKVVDKHKGEEHFLDPMAWTYTDRYSKHGDMMYQYAQCLRGNILREQPFMTDISIHFDVWCSLNGRFQQRMFDPRVDLLTAKWSPFASVTWLMPLLTELSPWRQTIAELQKEIYSWSNYSDVLFVADFPGLYMENYIHQDLTNVSLKVLEGQVEVEFENRSNTTLQAGEYLVIPVETFHKIYTVSLTPSCYMYTFTNKTLLSSEMHLEENKNTKQNQFAFLNEISHRMQNFIQASNLVARSLLKVLFSVPMAKRVSLT